MSFYGRNDELNELVRVYDEVAKGETRIVTLVGDTGLGKTRLIQEFYSYLSKYEDKNQYWPRIQDQSVHSMSIVPDFITLDKAIATEMSYLWMGLRCFNRNTRNNVINGESALNPLRRQIGLHLLSFYESEEKKAKRTDMSKGLLSIVANFAFPGGGPLIVDMIGEVVTNISTGVGTYDTVKSIISNLKNENIGDAMVIVENQQYLSLVEQTIEVFSIILSDSKKFKKLPIILVVDDVQWADDKTTSLIDQLIARGNAEKWPLMIVTTCWESDLKKQNMERLNGSYGFIIQNMLDKGIKPINLNLYPLADDNVARIIQDNIIGIDEESIEFLTASMSGDLELLYNCIERIKRTPGYLRKDGSLAVGHEKLNFKSNRKKEVIRERLQELGMELLTISSWGSLQGLSFTKEFINRCILKYSDYFETVENEFQRLDNPENIAIINASALGEIAEYKRQIYYEISKEVLDDLPYKEELEEILIDYYVEIISMGYDCKLDDDFRRRMFVDLINYSLNKDNVTYKEQLDYASIELAAILLNDGEFKTVINICLPLVERNHVNGTSIKAIKILIEAAIGMGDYVLEKEYLDMLVDMDNEEISDMKNYYLAKYFSRCNGERSVFYAQKLNDINCNNLSIRMKFKYFEQIQESYFYGGKNREGLEIAYQIDKEFEELLSTDIKSKTRHNHTIGLFLHNIDKNYEVVKRSAIAIEGYREIGDKYNYLISCTNHADALMGTARIEEALNVMSKCYYESNDGKYVHAKNIAAICYANILSYIGKTSQALSFYQEGIDISKRIGHSWDELYGVIWRSLCLSEKGDALSIVEIERAIQLANEKKFNYLKELSQTFHVLVMWNLERVIDKKYAIEIYNSLDKNTVPGMKLQVLAYNFLTGYLCVDDHLSMFDELIEVCQGVKGKPEIIKQAYDKCLPTDYNNSESIKEWIQKYVEPTIQIKKDNLETRI